MLSSDVYKVICSFSNPKDVLVLSRTCRTYHIFGSRDVVWKQFETWQDHNDKIVRLSQTEYKESELKWKEFSSQYSGGLRKFNGKYMTPLLEMPKYIKRDWLRLNLPTTFNISRFTTRMTIVDLSECMLSLYSAKLGRSDFDGNEFNRYVSPHWSAPKSLQMVPREMRSGALDTLLAFETYNVKVRLTAVKINQKQTARVKVPKQRKQYKKYLHPKRRFSSRYR